MSDQSLRIHKVFKRVSEDMYARVSLCFKTNHDSSTVYLMPGLKNKSVTTGATRHTGPDYPFTEGLPVINYVQYIFLVGRK